MLRRFENILIIKFNIDGKIKVILMFLANHAPVYIFVCLSDHPSIFPICLLPPVIETPTHSLKIKKCSQFTSNQRHATQYPIPETAAIPIPSYPSLISTIITSHSSVPLTAPAVPPSLSAPCKIHVIECKDLN